MHFQPSAEGSTCTVTMAIPARMPEQMSEERGRVEGIFLADKHGSQPRAVAIAAAHAGRGLEGDRHFDDGDSCHISLIEAEAIENMRAEHGFDLAPGAARPQLVVPALHLPDFIARRYQAAEVEC